MRVKNHIRILIIASFVWLLFLLLGIPDYYLQYSANVMVWFSVFLLIPLVIIIRFILKSIKRAKRVKISLWYAFYYTFPLAVYDYLYCGIYLGYGFKFIYIFWFLSIYYIILWILFPGIAFILNRKQI